VVPVKLRSAWLWLALAPLCWMAQGAIAWYLTGRACPAAAPPLSLGAARWLVIVVTVAALVGSVGALIAAGRARQQAEVTEGARGAPSAMTERSRFVALAGLVVGITLTLGLIFAALPALVFHACGEAR
jgi:hypothetical protein